MTQPKQLGKKGFSNPLDLDNAIEFFSDILDDNLFAVYFEIHFGGGKVFGSIGAKRYSEQGTV